MNNGDLLKLRQAYPLELKIEMSKLRIREWYRHYHGKVYVALSGGKDSTVLLDLVRLLYPNVVALFVDTGVEFPEIRQFVKTIDNVIWVKPEKSFKEVKNKYGFPVISKTVAMAISRYRNTSDPIQKQLRKYGGICPSSGKKQVMGVIPKKYHYLINAPFKISEQCCDFLKKRPYKKFNKESKLKPIVGTMASDSNLRKIEYIKRGCNSYESAGRSTPLAFWTTENIWTYINNNRLKYSSIYDMGYHNTGCVPCLFGVQYEEDPDRFKLLKQTHPKYYNYCMNELGILDVLTFIRRN